MTPEDIAARRQRHKFDPDYPETCEYDGCEWPCDAVRALDALEQERADAYVAETDLQERAEAAEAKLQRALDRRVNWVCHEERALKAEARLAAVIALCEPTTGVDDEGETYVRMPSFTAIRAAATGDTK